MWFPIESHQILDVVSKADDEPHLVVVVLPQFLILVRQTEQWPPIAMQGHVLVFAVVMHRRCRLLHSCPTSVVQVNVEVNIIREETYKFALALRRRVAEEVGREAVVLEDEGDELASASDVLVNVADVGRVLEFAGFIELLSSGPTKRQTDRFKHTALFDAVPSALDAGGAHCSSLPNSHLPPTATCSRHPLPLSGQNSPFPHIGGRSAVVFGTIIPFDWSVFNLLPPPKFAYPNGYSSRLHSRGKHMPSPVALTGASGGWAQNIVSVHSEMSLCEDGLSLTFFGEQGIGFPEAVRATPEGIGKGNVYVGRARDGPEWDDALDKGADARKVFAGVGASVGTDTGGAGVGMGGGKVAPMRKVDVRVSGPWAAMSGMDNRHNKT
ncbi:unnamed protein product [Cyclocybe aegerita]|uniref:Uncharacterized protein n=1 Tax=Cyclocybe aegerita TaxID=1973307 RepID=A0A8S0XZ94_CYCAE|nr:unnamed protein product [Cyclocybe aegerita]